MEGYYGVIYYSSSTTNYSLSLQRCLTHPGLKSPAQNLSHYWVSSNGQFSSHLILLAKILFSIIQFVVEHNEIIYNLNDLLKNYCVVVAILTLLTLNKND